MASVNLSKGEVLDLTKADASLKKLRIGLGWDVAQSGADIDLDAHAILLDANGKTVENGVVYFGNKSVLDGAVKTLGDNRTGDGEGDDETILLDLAAIPASVEKVVISVDIYQGAARNQNFGLVQNEVVRCVNDETGAELARFEPKAESENHTAIIFGEVYRVDNGWGFKAIGETLVGNLNSILAKY